MLAKNTGAKVIGFGSLILLPGETHELPEGFDTNHPTVKYYLSKGFIMEADGNAEAKSEASEEDRLAAEEKTKVEAEEIAKQQAKAAEIEQKIKALGAMKLEELQAVATSLEITFTSSDTKSVLAQKITEKYETE